MKGVSSRQEAATGSPGAIDARSGLLLRVWELRGARDYVALHALLAPVPRGELLRDPELGVPMAEALFHAGRWDRALALARGLRASCAAHGEGQLERRRLSIEGQVLYGKGRLAPAVRLWRRLLELAAAAGDELGVGIALLNLGSIASVRARWAEALSLYARAIAIGQRLGRQHLLAFAHGNQAGIYLERGLVGDADHHLRHGLALLRTVGLPHEIARMEVTLATLQLRAGDVRLAAHTALRARQRLDDLGFEAGAADALRVLGIVARVEGRLDHARDLLEEAHRRLRGGVDRVTEAEVLEERAVLEQAAGDPAAAERAAAAAARLYTRLTAPRRAARLRARLAGGDAGPVPRIRNEM
jgi:ATP/maltotriose-dependent transcriptional regulator MalT